MNPRSTAHADDLPLADLRQIDAACDRFEAAWQAGKRPDLTEYLTGISGPTRARLLQELLVVEVERRRERGEPLDAAEYPSRFPDDLSVLDRVFTELGLDGETLNSRRKAVEGTDVPRNTDAKVEYAGIEIAPAEIGTAALEALRIAGYEVIGELGRGGWG
jgi:serine/threonine-protein kinase